MPRHQMGGHVPAREVVAAATSAKARRIARADPPANPEAGEPPKRGPRVNPPTQTEYDALPVDKRMELFQARQQRPWQHFTAVGVFVGLLFTAGGLIYTASTWETGQEALRSTQQQQITDRYAKAVEQLGSTKVEVRIGGLYALARIAKDSPADATTIEDVVVAFILEHDYQPTREAPEPPKSGWQPGPDEAHAVRVLGMVINDPSHRRSLRSAQLAWVDWPGVDLTGCHLMGADLRAANLSGATLVGADLRSALLTRATLYDANLYDANLYDAYLGGATLTEADLRGADLRGTVLGAADLGDADLRDADLSRAHLRGAYLRDADLRGADLRGTELGDADLRGADLRRIQGKTEQQIRAVAKVDATTKF
ncbi:pentapeptide repeat-containing protein [Nonomuraea sp. NPDC050394]|uniref:pentapeptide repeat-containing protein n=1 Tax=Nonomuraea sp. NPDC050394 TaxID=3364363 RepID=UPI00378DC6EE